MQEVSSSNGWYEPENVLPLNNQTYQIHNFQITSVCQWTRLQKLPFLLEGGLYLKVVLKSIHKIKRIRKEKAFKATESKGGVNVLYWTSVIITEENTGDKRLSASGL